MKNIKLTLLFIIFILFILNSCSLIQSNDNEQKNNIIKVSNPHTIKLPNMENQIDL